MFVQIRSKVRPLIEGKHLGTCRPSVPSTTATPNPQPDHLVGFTPIPREDDSLTAQIFSLITLSDYFSFLELPTPVLWCWLAIVSIRTGFLYELLSRKGGNCLMIPKYIYLLNQVVM